VRRRTVEVSDPSDVIPSFSDVMEALENYASEKGEPPLMLGGWEVEDRAIAPPASLLRRLGERSAHMRHYAYARDLRHACEVASDLLSGDLRFAGSPLTAQHVSIQQNSTQSLLLTLAALKERGVRRVIIAAPAYYAIETICRSLSLEILVVPATDFMTGALDVARLCAAARAQKAVVLVTNPAYSLGVEYTPTEINRLASVLSPDTWLLLDETRLGLSWRYADPWYRNNLSPRTIIVRSPSKIFFIHGLKASLLLGDPALLRDIERIGEALVGSLAGDAESVTLAYLDAWSAWRDEVAKGATGPLSRWRRAVISGLQRNLGAAQDALLPAGFRFSAVDSGPYVFAAVPRKQLAHLDVLVAARQQGVLLMDARYFLHEHPDWHGFRINLCCDRQHQAEALGRLQTLWRFSEASLAG
jgi:histidinol-phosphate/aromatic aminotransferase/cobyric acid decarboxylase-like protein